MSKLKEEELLERLERIVRPAMDYLKYWENKDEQAYQQIKERIKDYAEHQELTANYIDIVIDLYDQLEKKKPEVTEEWIEKQANKMALSYGFVSQLELNGAKDFIRSLVEEILGK